MYSLYIPELEAWVYKPIQFDPQPDWSDLQHKILCTEAVDAAIVAAEKQAKNDVSKSFLTGEQARQLSAASLKQKKMADKLRKWGKENTRTAMPKRGTIYRDLIVLGGWVRRKSGDAQARCRCLSCGTEQTASPKKLHERKAYGCRFCGFTKFSKAKPDMGIKKTAKSSVT